MIVNDLDLSGSKISPNKTNAPLIVDTNTVLPFPIALQRLKSIAWQRSKHSQRAGSVQQTQPLERRTLNTGKTLNELSLEQRLGMFVFEALNHSQTLAEMTYDVKHQSRRSNPHFTGLDVSSQ